MATVGLFGQRDRELLLAPRIRKSVSDLQGPERRRRDLFQTFDPIDGLTRVDFLTYLPEDILTKLDRASMATSLEARVPFLDYRLVEFAWRLPLNFKIYRGQGKHLLRVVLARYIPSQLFERPKMGFCLPLDQWLRGPLRPWVEELLNPTRLQQEGIFNPAPIRQAWMEHLSEKQNCAMKLWGILMFQAWQQQWMYVSV